MLVDFKIPVRFDGVNYYVWPTIAGELRVKVHNPFNVSIYPYIDLIWYSDEKKQFCWGPRTKRRVDTCTTVAPWLYCAPEVKRKVDGGKVLIAIKAYRSPVEPAETYSEVYEVQFPSIEPGRKIYVTKENAKSVILKEKTPIPPGWKIVKPPPAPPTPPPPAPPTPPPEAPPPPPAPPAPPELPKFLPSIIGSVSGLIATVGAVVYNELRKIMGW